jgi:nucleoside-diphosphate-sugar epimerase
MRFLISGASGFIGVSLIHHLVTQGFEVTALSRSGKVEGFEGATVAWSLGDTLPDETLKGIDVAIHLAYDFNGESGAALTEIETLSFVSLLREQGVHQQIFFSSYSAGIHAKSRYGKCKYRIEMALSIFHDVSIIRPGLVLGNGGIYGKIKKWAKILPIIPLPNGGTGKVTTIEIDRLCLEVIKITRSPSLIKEANLFESELTSLRQLVLDAAKIVNKKPWIFPIPGIIFLFILRAAKLIRLPLDINEDNLVGFLENQKAQHLSSLKDVYFD